MKDYWKRQLTQYDADLCMMVENLTGMPCEPKNGGNHYFIVVDYSKKPDVDYVFAIMEAIGGRLGDRLIKIADNPDAKKFTVYIRFSKAKYDGHFEINEP